MTVEPLAEASPLHDAPRMSVGPGPSPQAPWLSVVLPAHNEAPHIARVAMSFLRAVERSGHPVEVVVVDDGSSDGTAEALRRGAADPRVRLVRRERCGGYGRALITGFEAARGEWIFFTDADGQFRPDEALGFLVDAELHGADLVLGYRDGRADPLGRRLLGRAWTGLVGSLLQIDARDVNCAYKLFRRQDVLAMGLCSEGAMINAELLHQARRRGLLALQRPVHHYPRQSGQQSGARPDVMARALLELVRYRLGAWRSPRRG